MDGSRIGRFLIGTTLIAGALAMPIMPTVAQNVIVPDNTLGAENSVVVPNGLGAGIDAILPGAIRGSNLFHSFQDFNIGTGNGAYFFSPNGIRNILARVTGGNRSEILGTLGTFGFSQPNLFLVNPNGIIFGPNASLDVGGSFLATTANAILLGNNGRFDASNPGNSTLLTIDPSALFFNALAAQSDIVNRSAATSTVFGQPTLGLQVPEGQTITLVGRNVQLDSSFLIAFGGRVDLGAVNEPATISLNSSDWSLQFPAGVARGDVFLNQAGIGVLTGTGGGGNVSIFARNVDLQTGSVVVAGIASGFGVPGTQAGNVVIDATGAITLRDASNIQNRVNPGATGNGGGISIKADSLSLLSGGFLSTTTAGRGNGGNIEVDVRNAITLSGVSANLDSISRIASSVFSGAEGNGGSITIKAGALSVLDGALINTSINPTANGVPGGRGNAGSVTVDVRGPVVVSGVNVVDNSGTLRLVRSQIASSVGNAVFVDQIDGTGAEGNAGDLTIKADSLTVSGFGSLDSSVQPGGRGDAGDIIITTTNAVELTDGANVSSDIGANAIGSGGNIDFKADRFTMRNGARVSASTFGQGDAGNLTFSVSEAFLLTGNTTAVFSTVESGGRGNAGKISVAAGSFSLKDGAQLQTVVREAQSGNPAGQGNAGDIGLTIDGTVSIEGSQGLPSAIFSDVNSGTSGNAGSIRVSANQLNLSGGGRISSSTGGSGKGGTITVDTDQGVEIVGASADGQFISGIQTDAFSTGDAGSVLIRTGELSLRQGGTISASTVSAGRGGNLSVVATDSVEIKGFDPVSQFRSGLAATTSGDGDGGNLSIRTRSLEIRDGGLAIASTFWTGQGGTLAVKADSIDISGTTADGNLASGLGVESYGAGDGGDLTIETRRLRIRDRGGVGVSTFGSGNGGNLEIDASELIDLAGASADKKRRSFIAAGAGETSTGKGGSLFLSAGKLLVRDGAEVTVSNDGSGDAGNLEIDAGSIQLDTQGRVVAATTSGEGGNIRIRSKGLLLLRRNSLISATAGGTGNGGNLDINAQFVVAIPQENSDIIANAFQGRGGNIDITTLGIFGLEFRPQLTPLSDITASSEFGLAGVVTLNTLDIDVQSGLTDLSASFVTPDRIIASSCLARRNSRQGSFVVTGTGGLPSNPYDALSGWYEPATPTPQAVPQSRQPSSARPATATVPWKPGDPIQEAAGLIIQADGQIWLARANDLTAPENQRAVPLRSDDICLPESK